MTGLDERQRGVLERIVVSSRITFEDDLGSILTGTYGISAGGTIEDEERLADDSPLRTRRRVLVEVLDYFRREGASTQQAVERLIREAAFTHTNRLIAIRVADELDVLPPSLRHGPRSSGFKQLLELAPLLATSDDTGGYWTYLQFCADELARDVPALFDPRNPLLALRPSKPAIDSVVERLSADEHADIWSADDTFGWAYQFFNTGDERRVMREASAAPRDSRELAVRNQFFTPRYVVDFLTQNTLGRRLLDAAPSSKLLEQLPLLVDPPTEQGEPVELQDVRVLDPACGSGHFLLGCYEILERAWQLEGVSPRDAAPRIVPCLWGIDIDPRAVQVAQAAVVFRARKACGKDALPPPNIVTARALPDDDAIWETATSDLTADRRQLVAAMRDALRDAPVLGPLLKVEERLAREIRSTVVGADPATGDLFAAAGIAADAFGSAERDVIAVLQRAADLTESSVADRLLAAGASDAIRFLEAVRHRYDAVLMNPPFGEPVAESKPYLRAVYPWLPTKDYNLLAAFVGRGVELCVPSGYMGAITSRAGMFLKTFENWRREVLLENKVITLVDLGHGVMEQALVEAAAYVIARDSPEHDTAGTYIRLLKEPDRPSALANAVGDARRATDNSNVYVARQRDFTVVPGLRLAYWAGVSMLRLFGEYPRLEGSGRAARQGLATGDNFRFVRTWWEVDPRRISHFREDTRRGKPWVLYAKGGEYSPFWADLHLVVNLQDDGQLIKESPGSVIRNSAFYFKPGVTWTSRTASAFGPRILPSGAAFDSKGMSAFSDSPWVLFSWLSTRTVRALLDLMVAAGDESTSGGAAKSYEVGLVQSLPWPVADLAENVPVDAVAKLVQLAAVSDAADETSHAFERVDASGHSVREIAERLQRDKEDRCLEMIAASDLINQWFEMVLDLDDAGLRYLDEEVGELSGRSPVVADLEIDTEVLRALMSDPIDAVIDRIVEEKGGSKAITSQSHIADRRVEVLARAIGVHPKSIVEARRRLGVLPESDLASTALGFVSWAVGLAFGRWDVRPIRTSSDFDPFAPLPMSPPGMLVGTDGFPGSSAPPGYPLSLPPDWVLLDEPGRSLDLVGAVEAASEAASTAGDQLLADAVSVLGRRSLREYLAKQFFRDHLSMYSKSRRQAPVYWQLTIPSGGWSAWLYAPRFSREMLFAVVREADRRLAAGAELIRGWEAEQSAGRSARDAARRIDAERTLIEQLTELRADVARVAGLGWEPDLDDGFVLNAAPLSRWFPKNTWKQAAEALGEIRAGSYEWSTIHRQRGQL